MEAGLYLEMSIKIWCLKFQWPLQYFPHHSPSTGALSKEKEWSFCCYYWACWSPLHRGKKVQIRAHLHGCCLLLVIVSQSEALQKRIMHRTSGAKFKEWEAPPVSLSDMAGGGQDISWCILQPLLVSSPSTRYYFYRQKRLPWRPLVVIPAALLLLWFGG